MAVIRISDGEASRDFPALLDRVRNGEEIIIESGTDDVAVLRPIAPVLRTVSECIALLPEDAGAEDNEIEETDEDFADEVEAELSRHRKMPDPPAWD
jgi:antitoxin (DNA-binding transcriptional repressor) of toxin-antitoxin stability system